MIIKVKSTEIYSTLGRKEGEFKLDTWRRDSWPLGKIALSFKIKKHRVLVQGTIDSDFDDDPYLGIIYHYYFTPKQPDKLKQCLNQGN